MAPPRKKRCSDEDYDEDISQLRQPITIHGRPMEQILNSIHYGSQELRDLLFYECDMIFECKVCRALFRDLPNFISHKRRYCRRSGVENNHLDISKLPDERVVIVQPQSIVNSEPAITSLQTLSSTSSSTQTSFEDSFLSKRGSSNHQIRNLETDYNVVDGVVSRSEMKETSLTKKETSTFSNSTLLSHLPKAEKSCNSIRERGSKSKDLSTRVCLKHPVINGESDYNVVDNLVSHTDCDQTILRERESLPHSTFASLFDDPETEKKFERVSERDNISNGLITSSTKLHENLVHCKERHSQSFHPTKLCSVSSSPRMSPEFLENVYVDANVPPEDKQKVFMDFQSFSLSEQENVLDNQNNNKNSSVLKFSSSIGVERSHLVSKESAMSMGASTTSIENCVNKDDKAERSDTASSLVDDVSSISIVNVRSLNGDNQDFLDNFNKDESEIGTNSPLLDICNSFEDSVMAATGDKDLKCESNVKDPVIAVRYEDLVCDSKLKDSVVETTGDKELVCDSNGENSDVATSGDKDLKCESNVEDSVVAVKDDDLVCESKPKDSVVETRGDKDLVCESNVESEGHAENGLLSKLKLRPRRKLTVPFRFVRSSKTHCDVLEMKSEQSLMSGKKSSCHTIVKEQFKNSGESDELNSSADSEFKIGKLSYGNGLTWQSFYDDHFSIFTKFISLKKLKCLKCQRNFSNHRSLIRHAATIHLKVWRFRCKQCQFKAFDKAEIHRHILKSHSHIRKPGNWVINFFKDEK